MMARATIDVIEPGLLTTVQDLGRPGMMRRGVSLGGALDRSALILGNRLCGNSPGAAGLEITLAGPRLQFTAAAVIALTGADLGAALDGVALPQWQPVAVSAGAELAFPPGFTGRGARAFLCVAGGIDLPLVLGSRSTDLAAGFGGLDGRAVRAGDSLPVGESDAPRDALLGRRLAVAVPEYPDEVTIRVVLGPQDGRFTKEAVRGLTGGAYTVSPRGDRMGVRLTDGPPLTHRKSADLISEGIVPGSLQVPGDAQPIALLPACQTMGGYPKIATVIGADLDQLAQARPGSRVRFTAVTPTQARAATLAYRAALGENAILTGPVLVPGWSPSELPVAAWTPDGVIRVIAALRDAGYRSFLLNLTEGSRTFNLSLGSDPDRQGVAPTLPAHSAPQDDALVHAPVLGVFYRRARPDEAPLVEPGARVTAGQVIGLIEVMKTYHEVTAPHAGILREFLVQDGAFVEYGQAIARLD